MHQPECVIIIKIVIILMFIIPIMILSFMLMKTTPNRYMIGITYSLNLPLQSWQQSCRVSLSWLR